MRHTEPRLHALRFPVLRIRDGGDPFHSGALLGERQVLTRGEELGGYPVGTVQTSTAITTTVVDSAPAGGTPNGALDEMGCEVTGPASFQCPPDGEGDE